MSLKCCGKELLLSERFRAAMANKPDEGSLSHCDSLSPLISVNKPSGFFSNFFLYKKVLRDRKRRTVRGVVNQTLVFARGYLLVLFGGVPRRPVWGTLWTWTKEYPPPPPPIRWTDIENITFPLLRTRAVITKRKVCGRTQQSRLLPGEMISVHWGELPTSANGCIYCTEG